MKNNRLIIGLAALFLSLLVSCFWAMDQMGLMAGVAAMEAVRWFWVTLLDLYIGLILAGLWMWHRELKLSTRGIWLVLFFGLGNMGVLLYLLGQIYRGKRLV